MHDHLVIFVAITDAIDTRHRRHNNAIRAFDQAFGRRQAHLLDVLIDRRILLDEEITTRHIRLGLVVIVIRDKILDRVFREELPELGIKLGRQRLVRGQDQCRPTAPGNHIGHGVGLARACHTQQRLVGQPVLQPFHQLGNRCRLVTGRRKRLVQAERATRKGDHRFIRRRRKTIYHVKIFGLSCA